MLCWFGCNRYGEWNGYVQPIKRVPEYVWIYSFAEKGFQKLKKDRAIRPKLNEVIAGDPRASPYPDSNKKPRLSQLSKREVKRRNKNAREKNRRNKS